MAATKSMLQLGYDRIFFQMVKHVLTDNVFQCHAAHTSKRYWTAVTDHVFVAFFKDRAYICISSVIS